MWKINKNCDYGLYYLFYFNYRILGHFDIANDLEKLYFEKKK